MTGGRPGVLSSWGVSVVRMLRTWIFVSALVLALVGVTTSAGAATAATDGEMAEQQAGRYFLDKACANNASVARMQKAVYGPDNFIPFAEVKRRFAEVKRATAPYAAAHYRFGRALLNPPAAWPSAVASKVDRLAANRLRMSRLIRRAAYAIGPRQWISLTNRAHEMSTSTEVIRAQLDLPPPGRGC